MQINLRRSALKDLKNIPNPFRKTIEQKMILLRDFPDVPNIKKLTNFEPAYRLRVGDYRILFDVTETGIEIARVMHRKESYL